MAGVEVRELNEGPGPVGPCKPLAAFLLCVVGATGEFEQKSDIIGFTF